MAKTNSPLHDKLTRIIKTTGPITLADYMHLCLADPEHGYYKSREAIGGKGDFVTAPEVSQMFGELIGIWCVAAWQAMDRPSEFALVELGPGKGTLMKDMLRAAKQLPAFLEAANIILIENSEKLIAAQQEMLGREALNIDQFRWHTSLAELPDMPAIFVGNEFLDAIPFRQYVKSGKNWNEIGVSLDEQGALQIGSLPATLDESHLPASARDENEGAVFEIAPAREAIVEDIATRIAAQGGSALFIDYGHLRSGFGDTFQAVKDHDFIDPLTAPGECDLTSHVDFERLALAAQAIEGVKSQLTQQSDFLLAMGLLERAGALGADKDEATQTNLQQAVERLAGPDQMGTLFKVMGIMPQTIRLPGFRDN